MNEIIRCKECKKPITEDNIKNTNSLCYECFRRSKEQFERLKSSKMNKGFVLKLLGFIGLGFVLLFLFGFVLGLSDSFFPYYIIKPLGKFLYILLSIIAILIPLLLIYFGFRKARIWKNREL